MKETIKLNAEEATEKYGKIGKNGALEIYSKENPSTVDRLFSSSLYKEKPLVILDDGRKMNTINEIDPDYIESITVLKEKSAVEKYGDIGENGVIEVTLKKTVQKPENEKIDTQLKLRKYIAKEIRYPEEAISSNIEAVITTLVEFDNDGNLLKIEELSKKKYIGLDEIVVVGNGYKNENDKPTHRDAEKWKLLGDETKRVVTKLPKIDIPEFKGQQVAITVRFVLQK